MELGNAVKISMSRYAIVLCVAVATALGASAWYARSDATPSQGEKGGEACAQDTGITLPPGFCATLFADNVGHARHMAVAADGALYLNTWSGAYYENEAPPPAGGFLLRLADADKDAKSDSVQRFGKTMAEGAAGGVGIALYKGELYAEEGDAILRYPLSPEGLPSGPAVPIVTGLPLSGDHPMHPFVIDKQGGLFMNSGSATNSCEKENRKPGSPGLQPCTELETRSGIWRYDAAKTNQPFSAKERYATGIRNTGGMAFDADGRLYGTQHGRDQLSQNWPAHFSEDDGVNLPAEEMFEVTRGADFGWPTCYYDGNRKSLMLAPEYGGDGKTVGACAAKKPPVAAFPAHWAPNDVAIYTGDQFPTAYRGGAFIAFHGSWNRAPAPQAGYNIVFQPLSKRKASGAYTIFADGFAGQYKEPGRATFRPAGLAVGPDGALFIADDKAGRIWRITYHGKADAQLQSAPPPKANATASAAANPLTPPPGYTADQVALGERIYLGTDRGGTCAGCHGSDAKGTSVGPDLISGHWLWADGSVASIAKVIREGVAKPKKFGGAMPPSGGSDLSAADIDAVSAYVWALGQK